MPRLIHPSSVTVTSEGSEVTVHITLDLNVNLGNLGVKADVAEITEEKTEWAIPDFSQGAKVRFGKKEGD